MIATRDSKTPASCKLVQHCDSACPDMNRAYDAYAVRATNLNRPTVMVIGGNKGFDCVGWSRMYSPSGLGVSIRPYRKHVDGQRAGCGVCMQVRQIHLK